MRYAALLPLAFVVVSAVPISELEARQFANYQCDGEEEPNWIFCEKIVKHYKWADQERNSELKRPGAGNNCWSFMIPEDIEKPGNCKILACWGTSDAPIRGNFIHTAYLGLADKCGRQNAGGKMSMEDPQYPYYIIKSTGKSITPDSPGKRDLGGEDAMPVTPANVSEVMVQKRDLEPERWDLTAISKNVAQPGRRIKILDSLPARSLRTITNTKSESFSVGASISMTAGMEFLVTATVGVEINWNKEWSKSNAVGVTQFIDCSTSQNGILYWEPYFTRYDGNFWPVGGESTIYVPNEENNGKFVVECTG